MGENRNKPVSAQLFAALLRRIVAGQVAPTRGGVEGAIVGAAFSVAAERATALHKLRMPLSHKLVKDADGAYYVEPNDDAGAWLRSETMAIAANALHLLNTKV